MNAFKYLQSAFYVSGTIPYPFVLIYIYLSYYYYYMFINSVNALNSLGGKYCQ